MLWDLNEGKHLYTLDGGDIINALCFSPNRYWLCAATGPSIKIWVWNGPLSPHRTTFLNPVGLGAALQSKSSPCPTDLVVQSPFGHVGWVALGALSSSPASGGWCGAFVGHSHCCAVMKLRCHLTASLWGNPEAVSEHPTACCELEGLGLATRGTSIPHALFCPAQDLEGKIIVDELKQEVISTSSKAEPPQCTSLAWSADGQVEASPPPRSLKTPRSFQHLCLGELPPEVFTFVP